MYVYQQHYTAHYGYKVPHLREAFQKTTTVEIMNLAQKEGGCLTRITIWKYSIIVKKLLGGGVERLTFPFFFHFMMIAYNKIYCLLPLPFSHKECQLNYFSFKCFPNIRFKSFEMIAFGTYCKIWSLSNNFVRFERQGPGILR